MVAKMPNRRYAYFRDDQITFLVTHEPGKISESQLDDFQAALTKHLQGRTIKDRPQAFSFPAITVENREQRLANLRELELKARNEELEKRQEELQHLKNLLGDRGGRNDPPELRAIKKVWKKDVDWQNLLAEVQKRLDLLNESQVVADDPPTLLDSPFSLLLCHLDVPLPNVEPEPLLTTIQSLRKTFKEELKEERFGGMKVEDVSPNWLMSVSSQGGATGGPGGLPLPFDAVKDGPAEYEFTQLRQGLEKAELYDEGKNVDVAILDAVPCAHDLVLAVKEWPDHPLLKTLLGPSGKLIPYHATYKALQRMASTSVNQHDYPMTNHGLFAAGIVHSIVPQATIHLIEVLNEFGVGDLASLAEGLALALDQIYKPGRRLVVNCSWMLELPLSDLQCRVPDEDEEFDFEQGILRYAEEEDRENALTLRTICNRLAEIGGVVAAAGNDKLSAKKRREKKLEKLKQGVTSENVARWIDYLLEYIRGATPEARYPAAFVSVVGVGALPPGPKLDVNVQKYVSSDYSNLGDKPAGDAIMTLGGEEGEDNQHKNKGILGLYLGRSFPRATGNPIPDKPQKREIEMYDVNAKDNPLAWWAGTSFAAPIVTGVIAAVFGTGIRRTQDAVNALKMNKIPIIDEAGTAAQEDVMYVKQGQNPA